MLVFSLDNKKSFENIYKWMDQINENIKNECIIFLIGNKKDVVDSLCDEGYINCEEIESMKKMNGKYFKRVYYFEVSAKNNEEIINLFKKMSKCILTKENIMMESIFLS